MELRTASDMHVSDDRFGRDAFTIDEGIDETGVRTVLHFEGRTLTLHKTQDMQPILDYVRQMREQNEGLSLRKMDGLSPMIGHIPSLFYDPIVAQFTLDGDRKARSARIRAFFKAHPAFCAWPAYLKD